jgi:hypothetical protein
MDDEDIRLRDKFAIEILSALIGKSNSNLIGDFIFNMDPAYKNDHPMDNKAAVQHLELSVRAAYKIADIMRKVRLTSFE